MIRASSGVVFLSLLLGQFSLAQSSPAPQSPEETPAAASSPSAPQAKSSTPKKVWTNENLGGAGGRVSVVGDSRNQKYSVNPSRPADTATVARIRESLTKLQNELAGVKQQLASFKEFEEGETVAKGSTEIPTGYVRVPVNQQIPALEEKKKKLQGQIDDLLDEARKKGIEPGQLR